MTISHLSRRHLLGAAAMTTAASAMPRHLRAADKVKAGFVYVGPVGDHGWTYRHDIGRQDVEKALGDQVETFVQHVTTDAVLGRFTKPIVFGGTFTAADAEDDAPARQVVERRRLTCQFVGPAPR